MIPVKAFDPSQQDALASFVLGIQNGEFGLGFTAEEQPDLRDTSSFYKGGGFWTAIHENRVVGCIGLQRLNADYGVLRKLFVAKAFRGGAFKLADKLFLKLRTRATEVGLKKILLDTPSVARASHRFYEKNGFVEIRKTDIPKGYSYPDRDSRIFELIL